jgi:hypothetical protein
MQQQEGAAATGGAEEAAAAAGKGEEGGVVAAAAGGETAVSEDVGSRGGDDHEGVAQGAKDGQEDSSRKAGVVLDEVMAEVEEQLMR